MDMPFMLYAMEQEGDLPTRQGKINKAIRMLKQHPDRNHPDVQADILACCGLTHADLTWEDIQYINLEVFK